MASGDITLFTSLYTILEKTQLNQQEQRERGTRDSSGVPKIQRFFVRDSYSTTNPEPQPTTSGISSTSFTSNFVAPTTTETFTASSAVGPEQSTSGFTSDFSASVATTAGTQADEESGSTTVGLEKGYVDEPNRLIRGRVAGDLGAGWIQRIRNLGVPEEIRVFGKDGKTGLTVGSGRTDLGLPFFEIIEETGDDFEGSRTFLTEVTIGASGGGGDIDYSFVLPVAKDTFVLVYFYTSAQFRASYIQRIKESWENDVLGDESAFLRYKAEFSLEEPPSEKLNEQIYIAKSFLISGNSVKEIPLPSVCEEKAKQFVYVASDADYTFQDNGVLTDVFDVQRLEFRDLSEEEKKRPIGESELNAIASPLSRFLGTGLSSSGELNALFWRDGRILANWNVERPLIQYVTTSLPDTPIFFFSDSLEKLKTLGTPRIDTFSSDVVQDPDAPGPFFVSVERIQWYESGPGLYYVLDNPTVELNPSLSGAQIGQDLFPNIAPTKSVYAQRLGEPDPKTFSYAGSTMKPLEIQGLYHIFEGLDFEGFVTPPGEEPQRPSYQGKPLSIKPNAYKRFGYNPPTRSGNLETLVNYYVAWDWDNPSYCRQKLKELGFTFD